MKEYLYAWIKVAVLAALAEMITPGGKNGKMAGHIRLVCGLCVLVAFAPALGESVSVIQQISHLTADMTQGSEQLNETYQNYFKDSLADMTEDSCQRCVLNILNQEFGIGADEAQVSVQIGFDENRVPYVKNTSILLSGKAVLKNPHAIETRISEGLAAPCAVSVSLP